MEMEMPKKKGRVKLDELAKNGFYKIEDAPGTDTYDDGMNEKGEVIMPGSTSTESGGNYMEDRGPNDMRRRNEEDEARANEGGLSVSEAPEEVSDDNDLYAGEDAAAKWLRENDPNFKKKGRDDLREAA